MIRNSLPVILGMLFFMSCETSTSHLINLRNVSHIEIRKENDSVPLRLTDQQARNFLKKWNKSESKGSIAIYPEYYLNIYFDNDSLVRLMADQHLVAHSDDFIYSFGDKGFFKKIWYDQAGIPQDFHEYTPVVKDKAGFKKAQYVLTDEHKENIKKVLTHYNHHWKDVRGQIFYKGKLKEELLWNYTIKAGDSSWLANIQTTSVGEAME